MHNLVGRGGVMVVTIRLVKSLCAISKLISNLLAQIPEKWL